MYCSTCGVAVAKGLSYCNYCGAKLVRSERALEPSEIRSEFLLAGMIGTFIFGLVAITMLLGMLKAVLRLETGQILTFAFLSFMMMIVLEGICWGLLLRNRRRHATLDSELPKEQVTNELNAAQARVLPEPIPSVTEHTTRMFEPMYDERTSK